MKNKKVIVLSLSIIVLIGVITFSFVNTKEKLDIKDIDANRLAVFVKQSDGTYKTETQIPQIGYTLNIDKSTCSNGAKPTWSNNTLSLSNLTSNNTNCYLYFDSDVATNKLKELGLTANTGTPDFSQVATTDEGIYGVEDGMYGGTSYYWRGAATTNYVKFAGFCWRAIRINGDGSIRLIYDGSTCHNNGESTTDSVVQRVLYNINCNRSEYVGYTFTEGNQRGTTTESNIKSQTEGWFSGNITGTNAEKVADGKFCNDRNTGSGYSWSSQPSSTFYYAGYDRSGAKNVSSITPTLACGNLDDVYALKAGAITMDEVVMAGIKWNSPKQVNYLYNGEIYWTMSTFNWNGIVARVYIMYHDGRLYDSSVSDGYVSFRPVINLRSDVTFTGNGTIDKPFVVEGAE